MEDWTKKTDESVFGNAGEMPGSQAAYWRETEIKRRLYLLEREAVDAQITATSAQQDATVAQREAISEMRWQSRMMLWSVIGAFLTALVTLVTAFIHG